MENKITLPISLNPGLKAWGLTTMNSLRKSLEENKEIENRKGGKKIKLLRNKDKRENSQTLKQKNNSIEEEYQFENKMGGSFYKQLLMPISDFDKILNNNKN